VVVLLAALAFISGSKPAGASASTSYASPQIIARVKLPNQNAPIPTTTIYTPTQTGLYRLSVYATMTRSDPNSQSTWFYSMAWTDDGGAESENEILYQNGEGRGQFNYNGLYTQGGWTMPFEAEAGTPITYNVSQEGAPDNSAYTLYYTLERLE